MKSNGDDNESFFMRRNLVGKHENSTNLYNAKNKSNPMQGIVNILTYFYSPSEKKIMNRSIPDFLRLLLFYFIFYTCLIGLLVGCMFIFIFFNVMQDHPKVTGKHSAMDFNPGLSVVPMTDYLTTLIHFKTRAKHSYRRYSDDLVAFTQWYEKIHGQAQESSVLRGCDKKSELDAIPDNTRMACYFDMNNAGPCNRQYHFGYHKGSPCVLIKLNQIYGWLPDPATNRTNIGIKCRGVDQADEDAMGELCYYDTDYLSLRDPQKTVHENCVKKNEGIIETYFFPYLKQSSYMNPVVFVQFRNPKRNVAILVECYAIANNIRVHGQRREGSVRFELLVD